jgi:hypothetical protein
VSELEAALDLLGAVVASGLPEDASWRLVLIGSAAAGEVTIDKRTGAWRSDVEAYLESPDRRLPAWLSGIRQTLSGLRPSFDLSGGDPRRMDAWETRQWLVDAARVGRRLAGRRDDWTEPFAAFAGRPVPRSEAAILLSNRCAGLLEGGDDPYGLAKALIDTVGAGLILLGRHRTTVRERLEAVASREVARDLVALGITPGVLDRFVLAAAWKLSGDSAAEAAFRVEEASTRWMLRICWRELFRVLYGPGGGDGVELFARWARGVRLSVVVRDWGRAFRRSPSAIRGVFRWRETGPLWGARIAVARAWIQDWDPILRRRALGDWKLVARGV